MRLLTTTLGGAAVQVLQNAAATDHLSVHVGQSVQCVCVWVSGR